MTSWYLPVTVFILHSFSPFNTRLQRCTYNIFTKGVLVFITRIVIARESLGFYEYTRLASRTIRIFIASVATEHGQTLANLNALSLLLRS